MIVSVKNVTIARPGGNASDDALFGDLTIYVAEGEGLGVIGPNGSGKSTFIRTIAGLLAQQAGVIEVSPAVRVGYMPQNYRSGVLSWLTLDEHFELTLDQAGREKAIAFLGDVGFTPDFRRRLAHMSGGEVQIIILATLVGQDCHLLLLDEPLSAVDFVRRGKAIAKLNSELKDQKRAMVMVSHHLEDARSLCRRLIVLSGKRDTVCKVVDAEQVTDLTTVFST